MSGIQTKHTINANSTSSATSQNATSTTSVISQNQLQLQLPREIPRKNVEYGSNGEPEVYNCVCYETRLFDATRNNTERIDPSTITGCRGRAWRHDELMNRDDTGYMWWHGKENGGTLTYVICKSCNTIVPGQKAACIHHCVNDPKHLEELRKELNAPSIEPYEVQNELFKRDRLFYNKDTDKWTLTKPAFTPFNRESTTMQSGKPNSYLNREKSVSPVKRQPTGPPSAGNKGFGKRVSPDFDMKNELFPTMSTSDKAAIPITPKAETSSDRVLNYSLILSSIAPEEPATTSVATEEPATPVATKEPATVATPVATKEPATVATPVATKEPATVATKEPTTVATKKPAKPVVAPLLVATKEPSTVVAPLLVATKEPSTSVSTSVETSVATSVATEEPATIVRPLKKKKNDKAQSSLETDKNTQPVLVSSKANDIKCLLSKDEPSVMQCSPSSAEKKQSSLFQPVGKYSIMHRPPPVSTKGEAASAPPASVNDPLSSRSPSSPRSSLSPTLPVIEEEEPVKKYKKPKENGQIFLTPYPIFLERFCKHGPSCKSKTYVEGVLPDGFNHTTALDFISAGEPLPINFCRWEQPWNKKRCLNKKCLYDHIRGRVAWLDDMKARDLEEATRATNRESSVSDQVSSLKAELDTIKELLRTISRNTKQ
jgi:hypothetical protein